VRLNCSILICGFSRKKPTVANRTLAHFLAEKKRLVPYKFALLNCCMALAPLLFERFFKVRPAHYPELDLEYLLFAGFEGVN